MLLISSLEHGGAERQVVELVRNLDRKRFDPVVCSLSDVNPLADHLPDPARELVVVKKRSKYDFSTVRRVAAVMKERRISIVHAFLFDAEMVARVAARRAGVPLVIASERNTDYCWPWIHKVCQLLTRSRFDVMIANSEAGKRFNMRTLGLLEGRIRVVHNGVDTERFRPVDTTSIREELGIGMDDHVVGMVAMFKRQKNHGVFFRAAKDILCRFPNTWFLLAGEPLRDNLQGAGDYHCEMRRLVEELGVSQRCLFVGNREDMPEVYSLCDATVLPSLREGTPNVLLESMACAVPVVASDVADNHYIVKDGETGFVVPPGDVAAIVDRVCAILEDPQRREELGRAGRAWVSREFSTTALARKTETVYLEGLQAKVHGQA
ncbi:MAG: glycosyltransferase [Phycisphaerales bacterium]|nr:MAG: glycosyltransferase [Phycisphaerales bacterium]